MKFCKIGLVVLLCLVGMAIQAQGDVIGYRDQGAGSLPLAQPDYDWWYGCSPTSAGMLVGNYDRNGYGGLTYDDLVPGGTAEPDTFVSSTGLANNAIASSGHIADFWTGYGNSGDDPNPATNRSFDCLADFMGTSQDSGSNVDGGTTFYYYTNGARLTYSAISGMGIKSDDGMYGMGEYVEYAGYGVDGTNTFTQLTDNLGLAYGFSLADFQNEIDAGRGVMLHVTGHSMYGYGYDDLGNVLLHDTWTLGQKTMAWGGAYSGLDMWGVTVLELTGGDDAVPEPASMIIWAMIGGLGVGVSSRRRRRQA